MCQRRPSGPARPVWARTAAPGPFSQEPVCPEGVRCRRSFWAVCSCSRSSDCTPGLWENRWNIAHVSENTRSTHYLMFPLTSLPPVFLFPVWTSLFSSQLSFTSKLRGQELLTWSSQSASRNRNLICVQTDSIYAGISKFWFHILFLNQTLIHSDVQKWSQTQIKTIVRKLRFKWMFIHWSNARQSHFQFILVNIYIMWNGWIKTNGWLQSYSLLTAQCRRVGPCAGRTAGVCDAPSPRLSLVVILLEGQITGTNGDIWLNTDASEQNHHPSMGFIFRQK